MKEDVYRSLTYACMAENAVHIARDHVYEELRRIAKYARRIKPRNISGLQDILNETSILISLDKELRCVDSYIEVYPTPKPEEVIL